MTTVTLCDFKGCGKPATYRMTLEKLGYRIAFVNARYQDDWTLDVCDKHLANVTLDTGKIDDSLWAGVAS